MSQTKKKKKDEFTQNDTEIEEYRNTRISEFLDKRYIYTHGKSSNNQITSRLDRSYTKIKTLFCFLF